MDVKMALVVLCVLSVYSVSQSAGESVNYSTMEINNGAEGVRVDTNLRSKRSSVGDKLKRSSWKPGFVNDTLFDRDFYVYNDHFNDNIDAYIKFTFEDKKSDSKVNQDIDSHEIIVTDNHRPGHRDTNNRISPTRIFNSSITMGKIKFPKRTSKPKVKNKPDLDLDAIDLLQPTESDVGDSDNESIHVNINNSNSYANTVESHRIDNHNVTHVNHTINHATNLSHADNSLLTENISNSTIKMGKEINIRQKINSVKKYLRIGNFDIKLELIDLRSVAQSAGESVNYGKMEINNGAEGVRVDTNLRSKRSSVGDKLNRSSWKPGFVNDKLHDRGVKFPKTKYKLGAKNQPDLDVDVIDPLEPLVELPIADSVNARNRRNSDIYINTNESHLIDDHNKTIDNHADITTGLTHAVNILVTTHFSNSSIKMGKEINLHQKMNSVKKYIRIGNFVIKIEIMDLRKPSNIGSEFLGKQSRNSKEVESADEQIMKVVVVPSNKAPDLQDSDE